MSSEVTIAVYEERVKWLEVRIEERDEQIDDLKHTISHLRDEVESRKRDTCDARELAQEYKKQRDEAQKSTPFVPYMQTVTSPTHPEGEWRFNPNPTKVTCG